MRMNDVSVQSRRHTRATNVVQKCSGAKQNRRALWNKFSEEGTSGFVWVARKDNAEGKVARADAQHKVTVVETVDGPIESGKLRCGRRDIYVVERSS